MLPRPLSRTLFVPLALAYVGLRLWLATLAGYAGDIDGYKDWAMGSALWGVSSAYEKTAIDYPPLVLYLLRPIGEIYLARHPELRQADIELTEWDEYLFETRDGRRYRSWSPGPYTPELELEHDGLPESTLFTTLIKAPFVLFDLALAGVLYWLVARGGLWGESRTGAAWGRSVVLAYLWNPAVLFDSGYWGQADSIHALLVVASLACLAHHRFTSSGALLSLAGAMKPLAAPLLPLVAGVAALRGRWSGVGRLAVGGAAAAVLVLSPFLVTGRLPQVVRRVLLDLDSMPFASVNGHSLWWALLGLRKAYVPVLGPLTPTTIGLVLFVAVYGLLMRRAGRWLTTVCPSELPVGLFVLAAAVYSSFFFLSTHMHENHLLLVIPLLLAVAGRSRQLGFLTLAATGACLINMLLHEPQLVARLPGVLGRPAGPSMALAGQSLTWGQLLGGYANTLLCGVVTAWTCRIAWLRTAPGHDRSATA